MADFEELVTMNFAFVSMFLTCCLSFGITSLTFTFGTVDTTGQYFNAIECFSAISLTLAFLVFVSMYMQGMKGRGEMAWLWAASMAFLFIVSILNIVLVAEPESLNGQIELTDDNHLAGSYINGILGTASLSFISGIVYAFMRYSRGR